MSTTTLPLPESIEEYDFLSNLIRNVRLFPKMLPAEQDHLLRQLEAFECHGQVVGLLEWRIQQGGQTTNALLSEYTWLMRIQYFGLEDFDGFVATVRRATKQLRLLFSMVRIHIAEEILGPENFLEQSKLYEAIVDAFVEPGDRVLILERLALIYEKKLFQESKVSPCYERILEIDPRNMTAIRFFERLYRQNGRWEEDAKQLLRLMEVAQNPHEKQRFAHELARIYLHHLKKPQDARDVILEHCANSPIDTHEIMIESLERLEYWDELLTYLQKRIVEVSDVAEKAALKLKEGDILRKARRLQEATVCYRGAIALDPVFFQAYETLLSVLMDLKEYDDVYSVLESLQKKVDLPASQTVLARYLERLGALKQLDALSNS